MHTRTTRRRFRLQRQTFSIWWACWRPYWISRLAIIYANLCRQFQILQTIGNILIYDTSCCTGAGGGRVRVTPRKSGQFHSLSPYQKLYKERGELRQRWIWHLLGADHPWSGSYTPASILHKSIAGRCRPSPTLTGR